MEPETRWFTSSFSGGNEGGCVEVAFRLPPAAAVALRDTKDRTRPAHRYAPAQWAAFVAGVRTGAFDPR